MTDEEKQEEFLRLLDPVHADLSRFARAMTHNRDEACDLISETILSAYESFSKIIKRESFKSYLFTIAVRHYKQKKRKAVFWGIFDEQKAENLKSNETNPETALDIEILYSNIRKLPQKQQEAIVLFEISGFSIEEIRVIQSGTLSGVKSRLKRAREKLSELMNQDFEVDPEKTDKNNFNKVNDTSINISVNSAIYD